MIRTLSAALAFSAMIFVAGPTFAAGGGEMSGPIEMPNVAPPTQEEIKATYNQGVGLIQEQNWKKAVTKFAFVTEHAPDLTDAWNYLGYTQRKAGNAKKSEAAYKKALKLDPNHPRANEYYAELLLETNRLPEAEERLAVLNACCASSPEAVLLTGLVADAKAGKPIAPALKAALNY
jgi:Flp pilus assembly protein TadD